MATTGGRGKDKMIAGILAILLGGLGVHHFYLGSVGAGVVTLLLSCLCVGGIIGLVEGIMLLVMPDDEFNARYNQRAPESMEFVFTKPKLM